MTSLIPASPGGSNPARSGNLDGTKPKVLLLADRPDWAYDTAAKAIAHCLKDEFSFEIAYVRQKPDLDQLQFDLVHVFFWGETWHQQFVVDPRRVIKEISSHRWANEAAYGRLDASAAAKKFLLDAGTLTATSKRLQNIFNSIRPVHWCPNGFNPEIFKPGSERQGPLRIGWAGNQNDPCKGVKDILLPAVEGEFELHIAGGDLDSRAMADFYRSIDILCVASTAEGEPLTLIEGMACGCFAVCVDVGIVPELVEHARNGLIVERSPGAFREAFRWCARNLTTVRQAGANNAGLMLRTRTWEQVAPHWGQVFNQALKMISDNPPARPQAPVATASPEAPRKTWQTNLGNNQQLAQWPERAQAAAALLNELKLPSGATLVDLGCGHQTVRALVPAHLRYVPVDCVPRTPDTLVMDLAREFPAGRHDAMVMLGLLEYFEQPLHLLSRISASSRHLVFSYNDDPDPIRRRKQHWKPALHPDQMLQHLRSEGGVLLRREDLGRGLKIYSIHFPEANRNSQSAGRRVGLLSAAVTSTNSGDAVITDAIRRILAPSAFTEFPLLRPLTDAEIEQLNEHDAAVICGTNLYQQKFACSLTEDILRRIKIPIIPLGVGASAKIGSRPVMRPEDQRLVRMIHDRCNTASVRDPVSLEFVRQLGITNVALTGCPVLFHGLRNPAEVKPSETNLHVAIRARLLHVEDHWRYKKMALLHRICRELRPTLVLQSPFDLPIAEELKAAYGVGFIWNPDTHDAAALHDAVLRAGRTGGFRLHFAMLGLSHGRPATLIGSDTRVSSFADMMELPWHDIRQCSEEAVLKELQEPAALPGAFCRNWEQLRGAMSDTLAANDLPHLLNDSSTKDGTVDRPVEITGVGNRPNSERPQPAAPACSHDPKSGLPRILLIADVPNWIFERHCQVLREGLSDEFSFEVAFRGQAFDEAAYDLIYPLEFNLIEPAQVRDRSRYVTGIRSHSSWAKRDPSELTRILTERFQRVHVVSRRLWDAFAPLLPNVDYVTHGVDTKFFACRNPVSQPSGALRVGWAGNRKNSTKGFAQFIEPLGKLPGVELVFCGYSDRNLDREAMHGFYESIDVYVCTSLSEGNNNSLLEAAAMGRAIVTTDVGTVPEFLQHEESALIVPRTFEAIANSIERLRDDPGLRTRLGTAARRSVCEHFEVGARLEEFRAWFRAALNRRSASRVDAGSFRAPGAGSLAQHLSAGQAAINEGNIALALGELSAAVRLAPRDADLHVALGNIHLVAGDLSAARQCFDCALKLDPHHPEAEEAVRQLTVPSPTATAASSLLVEIERQARAALAIDPNGVEALRLLANVCLQTSRWPEAAQAAARVLAQKPDDVEALLMLAKCFFQTGDRESCRLALERVLEFDPGHELARENLVALGFPPAPKANPAQRLAELIQAGQEAIARGDALAAIQALEQAVILNPKDADLRVAVAGLHLAVGEVEPARRHLAQAVLHVPNHTEARKLLLELALGEPVSDESATVPKLEGRHSCRPTARRAEMARGDRSVALRAERNNAAAFTELQRGFDLLKERNFAEAEIACRHYQALIDYDALDRTDNRPAAQPKVSVVIVAYNINEGLIECLDSIAAQSSPPHEIIVVDNGRNEAIHAELARRPILHVRVGFNVILAEGRNIGIHFARAPIAAFIDDDALAGPHYLESILEAFNTFDIHALRGRVLPKTDHPNNKDVKHYDLGALPLPCFNNAEGNSATRVDTWRKLGGQDPLLFGSEGVELSYRLAQERGDAATIYWPWTTIRHDYAVTDAKKETKNSRHELMREYAEWKHAGLAEAYDKLRRNYRSEADRTRLATTLAAGAGVELPGLLARLERKYNGGHGAGEVASPVEALRTALVHRGWPAKFDAYAAQLRRIEIVRPVVNPDLSVVIIAHEIRPDCLKVLQKLRAETGSHFEVIYVINGSGVPNVGEVRPLVDTLIELRTNTGAYFARNVGAAFAAAPILFFLDDDAIPESGLIAAHLDAFRKYDAISVRGAIVGKTNNPLNALAKHYHLGPKPFPVQADVEGNTSYRADAFFAVGGWDDEINFGGGGIDLAFRLLTFDADRRRQIYSPEPVVYHDYAKDQQHLTNKHKKQEQSRERLRKKHPQYDRLKESWRSFHGCSALLIEKRAGAPAQSRPVVAPVTQPLITIAIPTFNRGRFLPAALNSVFTQDFSDFEVVVVDDGSTDDTAAVMAKFTDPRLRFVRKEHSGGPATRNRCVAEARGEFILWLDSDDALLPGTLRAYAVTLARDPEADVLYGDLLAADDKLAAYEHWTYRDYRGWPAALLSDLAIENCVPNVGTMVRRACYERAGGYAEAFPRAHDYEFWTRLAPLATFRHVQRTVALYRRHDDSLTKFSKPADTSFEAKAIRNLIERHPLAQLYPACFASGAPAAHGEARAWLLAALSLVKYGDLGVALDFARRSVAAADLGVNARVSGILQVISGRSKSIPGAKAVDEFGRLVEQAAKHFAAGQVQPCAQACAKLTELRPDAIETLLLVGLSLRRWANPHDARTAFHCLVQRQCERAHLDAVTESENARRDATEAHPLAKLLPAIFHESTIPNEAITGTLAFIGEAAGAPSIPKFLAGRRAGQTPLFSAILGLSAEELTQVVDAATVNQIARVRAALQSKPAANARRTPGYSFCIITAGQRPAKLARQIASIHALKLPACEILVGGEVSGVPGDVIKVDLAEAARMGRLGRMRNELCRRAKFDQLVVCDDDLVFDPGFVEGLKRFGEGYDAMAVRIVNPDGSRFWDWATTGGLKGSVLLDYWDADPNIYITGGFCVLKAEVFDRVQWDEHRGFYEREDVDFSTRLKAAGFAIRFNPFCTVLHDDDRYSRVGRRIYQFAHLLEAILQAHRAGELEEVRRLFADAIRMAGSHADRRQAVQAVAKQMNRPELLAEPAPCKPVAPLAQVSSAPTPVTNGKLEINWQGSFLDYGSLSNINRVLTDTLVIQNGASIRRLQTAPVTGKLAKPLQSYRGKLAAKPNTNASLTVRHAWPPDWSRPASGKLAVIQPWEFGSLPKDWVKAAANVDAFWVPSNYVRQVYVESGVPAEKVHVLPNGIDPKVFTPDAKPLPLATKKSFKFLFVGGTIYRKGPDVLLKAYVETFTAQDDVCLVIKDFGGGSVYAGQTLEQQIREIQKQANAPEILYLNQDLPPHELPGLYTACDCLAHPYRGEGFGLPVLEAMACGRPVIVTAGGATDDFVPDDAGWKIPAKRQVFGREISGMPLVGDGWLLEPDADAVKWLLRRAFANRDEARAKGRFAGEHARQHWTWNHTAHRLAELARDCAAGHRAAGNLPAVSVTADQRKPARPLRFTLPAVAKIGHLGAARELLQQGRLVPAWNAVVSALAIRPCHPEAWLLLAEIAGQAGDAKRMQECVDRARALAPNWKSGKQFAGKHSARKPAGKIGMPALTPPADPRLSVCLIAKNEEKFLGQCLRSVKSIAHQIVVVDTGSTDRTVAIAKEHGAEIHRFAWCDDFSAARNAALEHATGDWVLVLDADEELSSDGIAELKQAMTTANAISWRLPIVDVGCEAEGCTYVPRLFRNAPGLFYVSRVHEQVFSSVEVRREEWGMETGIGTAKLIHHGYTAEILRDRNKVERNLRLLELAIEEIPGDPNLLMNCGLELIRSGRTDEGLQRYAEAFTALNEKPAAEVTPELRESLLTQYTSHLMKFSRWQDIIAVLNSPVARRDPLSASLCFTLGLAHQELHQWPAAVEQFRFCLKRRNTPSFYLVNQVILTGAPRHCLALALWQSGQIADAGRTFDAALNEDASLAPLRMDAGRFQAEHGEPIAALKLFHGLVTENPALVDAWVRGAKVALSHPDFIEFARDWTVEAIKHHPTNRDLIAARGETLLLTQQFRDALHFWRQLNGHPRALSARLLCELMQGEFSIDVPPANEAQTSQEFLHWYRRLVAFRAAEAVGAVGERLELLSPLLPAATRALAQVLEAAAVEAA